MADSNIKISELTGATALQLDANTILLVSISDGQTPPTYGSRKISSVDLARLLFDGTNGLSFPQDLNTTAKDIFGAINELAQGGGGGSSVAWSQLIATGTKIAEITINGSTTDVYAPTSGGASYTDVTGTLVAGNTSITLSDASILTTSTIDIYTDVFGVNPTSVVVATGSVTLTFPEQANNIGVKVRVS